MGYQLLTRDGCELCEDAALALTLDGRVPFSAVPVDSRTDWLRRYGDRIPVLLDPQGLLVLAAPIDAEAVDAFVSKKGSGILQHPGPSAEDAD